MMETSRVRIPLPLVFKLFSILLRRNLVCPASIQSFLMVSRKGSNLFYGSTSQSGFPRGTQETSL
jgi:hypothetical protein